MQGFPSAMVHLGRFLSGPRSTQSQHMTWPRTQAHTVLRLGMFMIPPTYSSITFCISRVRLRLLNTPPFSHEFQAVTLMSYPVFLVQPTRGWGWGALAHWET